MAVSNSILWVSAKPPISNIFLQNPKHLLPQISPQPLRFQSSTIHCGLRELRVRIDSIKNTQKITEAMKLVAAARVRRAQEAVINGRPFAETLVEVLYDINERLQCEDIDVPLTNVRPVKKVAIVVITADRGLCGGFNNLVVKKAEARIAELKKLGLDITLISVGKKGNSYFMRRPEICVDKFIEGGLFATTKEAQVIADDVFSLFVSEEVDKVELVYNKFVSLVKSEPVIHTLLPLSPKGEVVDVTGNSVDAIEQRSKTVDCYPLLVAPTSPVNCSSNCHRGTPHEYERCNMSRSAPTSAFSSPAVSPRRSNTTGGFFTSSGAPHDQNLDVFPPRLSPNKPSNSPSHSPTSRSPRFNQKSSNGNAFLLPSLERVESSGQVSAHPLPLPPPPQQSVMHHNAEALSLSSMKGQWQKGKLIGRGTFGSVYLATNRETGALCAMKEVDLIPDDPKAAECIKQLEQEIKVLRTLKHPNIVQYYGSEMTEDHFYIYLEYVHPGSINKYVQDHIGAMTESVVRNFTRHILSGLAFLHRTKTIHRDIKGANLLVDASGVVKLADFGVAKHLNGQSYNLSLKGSPYWMAPEVIRAAMQNSAAPDLALAVDIWSLGCTIVEMFNGKPPWSEFTGPQAMFKVLNTIPDIPETLSAEGKDFLHLCFRRNPAERPLASKLLEHPFVRNSHIRPFQ